MLSAYATASDAVAERLRRDDRGATAVEYGLIIALISTVIVAAVTALGGQLKGIFCGVGI